MTRTGWTCSIRTGAVTPQPAAAVSGRLVENYVKEH